MIQDNSLHTAMRRFFQRLPSHYLIAEDEQIELIWTPLGKNQTYRECFPNLEQASHGAILLGLGNDVFLQAVVESGTTPWNTDSTDLLAG